MTAIEKWIPAGIHFFPEFFVPALLASMLTGCAAPSSPPPASSLEIPKTFKAAMETPAAAKDRAFTTEDWWMVYSDPVLNDLVARANKGNSTIHVAAARLSFSRAAAQQNQSVRSPQITLNAGANRQQGPLLNAIGEEGTLLTLGSTISYEMDVWGRLAETRDAASLDADSSVDLLKSAQLLTQAHVTQTYLTLRALDEEISMVEKTFKISQEMLRIHTFKYQSGSISELELERLKRETEALSTELLSLAQHRTETENALAVLTGALASEFQLNPSTWVTKLPAMHTTLPATVVARRPDVASAQKLVLAAQKRLGLAQTAWFPNLTLSGTTGYASPEPGTLFKASMQTLVFGAFSSLPLFDGGRRKSAVAMADAELSAAISDYENKIALALTEVENQLAASRTLKQKGELAQNALHSAVRQSTLSASRFNNGLISQLDLLESQRTEQASRRKVLQIQTAQYQQSVSLIKAIGGGWN